MKISDMLIICLRNLWRRKGRTMLTVVGVVIGSCAVIVMISLGLGMNVAMDNMLSSWGDLTSVTIYNGDSGYYMESSSSNNKSTDKPLLDDAAIELFKSFDNVDCVIPRMEVPSDKVTVASGRNDRYKLSWAQIYGVDFSLFDKMGYEVDQGALPNENTKSTAMVIGCELAYRFTDTKKHGQAAYTQKQQLADGSYTKPFIDEIGSDIKIAINNTKKQNEDGSYQYGGRGYEHKLVSVATLKQDAMWETQNSVFIDIDLAKQILEDYNRLNSVKRAKALEYSQVKILCKDINSVEEVQNLVTELGYNATSMAQIRKEMQGSLGVIQLILGGLAAISLLVAAISITNTMIMSIYERTREIGIMKVLGCFIGNIRLTFLMEAGLIGLFGGIIGTLISFVISIIMNSFAGSVFSDMLGIGTAEGGQVSIIPLWLVLLALAFSTIIGLISGYYPANRAVKISALEAIKNE